VTAISVYAKPIRFAPVPVFAGARPVPCPTPPQEKTRSQPATQSTTYIPLAGPRSAPRNTRTHPLRIPKRARSQRHRQVFHGPRNRPCHGPPGRRLARTPRRDEEEHTEKLVEQLKLKTGDIVADIGAGTGLFQRRLAPKVGRQRAPVLAVEFSKEMLDLLTNRWRAETSPTVKPVLGRSPIPSSRPLPSICPPGGCYHEFDHPTK